MMTSCLLQNGVKLQLNSKVQNQCDITTTITYFVMDSKWSESYSRNIVTSKMWIKSRERNSTRFFVSVLSIIQSVLCCLSFLFLCFVSTFSEAITQQTYVTKSTNTLSTSFGFFSSVINLHFLTLVPTAYPSEWKCHIFFYYWLVCWWYSTETIANVSCKGEKTVK